MEEKNWAAEFTTELICEEELLIDMHPLDLAKQIDKSVKLFEDHMKNIKAKLTTNKKLIHSRKIIKYKVEFNKVMDGWAVWSGKFNRIVRRRLAELNKEINIMALQRGDETALALNEVKDKLSYTYAYWRNRFDYLQTQVSGFGSLRGKSTKAGIDRGKKTLSGLIEGSVGYNKLSPQFKDVIDKIVNLNSNEALTELKEKQNVKPNNNS